MVTQRVYAIALGYEDLNDHDQLRSDPLLALWAGKRDLLGAERQRERDRGPAPAGKSTLNRLERTTDQADRYKKISCEFDRVDELLLNTFIEAHVAAPAEVILDLDVSDSPLHGEQEGRFFHGYYRHYCYLPLYIFAGGGRICCARGSAGPTKTPRRGACKKSSASLPSCGRFGPRCASSCGPTRVCAANS